VTFLYLGDVQKGIEEWSSRYQAAVDRHPAARFTIQVGDLVNLGARRTDYDAVFGGAVRAFATVPFVPVLGNHEYFMGGETLFERQFALSGGGPSGPGHCRTFDYGPVRVVVLDSSSDKTLAAQAEWLAARLAERPDAWKIVAFHHPVWPPRSLFADSAVRAAWMATLEGHGAHLVLSGHDHSYARTFPLRDGRPVPDGTVYVVAVAGSKSYDQGDSPRIAKGIARTPTYQVITASRDRLVLSTRTWDGIEVDLWERGR
jgi:3',5'-cyclic AMP phosphodiesterase CpdA